MLIEPIIEFELRGPGPPGRTCSSKTVFFYDKTKCFMVIFMTKQKSPRQLYSSDYLLLKILLEQCALLFLHGPSHL